MQLASKLTELSLALGGSELCSHHLDEPQHLGITGALLGLQRSYWSRVDCWEGKVKRHWTYMADLKVTEWAETFLSSAAESGSKAESWGKWVQINLICSQLKIILERSFWGQNLPPRVLEVRLAVVCDWSDKGRLLPRCPIKTLSKYHFHKVLSAWNTSQLFGSSLWSEVSQRLWGKEAPMTTKLP